MSHASAAALLGLPQPFAPTPVWGTVPRGLPTRYGTGTRRDGGLAPGRPRPDHRSHPPHLCRPDRRGLPAPPHDRRCRRRLGRRAARVPGRVAAGAGGARRLRGLAVCTARPRRVDPGRTGAASPRSSRGRGWLRCDRDYPSPSRRSTCTTSDGVFLGRVDAWWPEHGVVGEVDGLTKYGLGAAASDAADVRRAVQAVVAEKQREDLLRRTGLHVVRWGSSDLRQEPRWAQTIRTELRPRRPGAGAGAPGTGAGDASPPPPPLLVPPTRRRPDRVGGRSTACGGLSERAQDAGSAADGLAVLAIHVGEGGSAVGVGGGQRGPVAHHHAGDAGDHGAGRVRAAGDGVGGDHRPRADHRAPQDADPHAQPRPRADDDRRLADALVLDRHVEVGVHVVEVGDVDPVGQQAGLAEVDVEVAVHGAVAAEHGLSPTRSVPSCARSRVRSPTCTQRPSTTRP